MIYTLAQVYICCTYICSLEDESLIDNGVCYSPTLDRAALTDTAEMDVEQHAVGDLHSGLTVRLADTRVPPFKVLRVMQVRLIVHIKELRKTYFVFDFHVFLKMFLTFRVCFFSLFVNVVVVL